MNIDLNSISDSLILIFEIQAKTAKLGISCDIITEAIDELIKRFRIVPFYYRNIIETSFAIRREIPDCIDCTILATAICRKENLMTEDRRILSFMEKNVKMYEIEVHPMSFYLKG